LIFYSNRDNFEDSSGGSTSESDSSTDEDEVDDKDTEIGIPVSATQGDRVDVLWDRIQQKVFHATGNKHIVFTIPTDGPQLR